MTVWDERAACRGEVTDLWFDDDPAIEAAALSYCAVCPVQDECRAQASAYRETEGIWGGLRAYVPEEREILHDHPPSPIPQHDPRSSF